MAPNVVAGLALVLCSSVFGIATSVTQLAIVDVVNAKLPKEDQFNELGWYFGKSRRLNNAYRRFYPSGRLLWRQGVFAASALGCLVLAASFLGFGWPLVTWFGGAGAVLLWFVYFRNPS